MIFTSLGFFVIQCGKEYHSHLNIDKIQMNKKIIPGITFMNQIQKYKTTSQIEAGTIYHDKWKILDCSKVQIWAILGCLM